MKRRVNMAPFLHKPPVVDDQLEVKLQAEWPAILRWMIDGSLDWRANGLIRPKAVIEATSKYFNEQDTLRQWVEECCDVGPNLADTNATLFINWTDYAKLHGEEIGSQKRLSSALERLGFVAIKDQAPIRGRGFKGLKVKAPAGRVKY